MDGWRRHSSLMAQLKTVGLEPHVYLFPLGYGDGGLPPLEFPTLFPDKCNDFFLHDQCVPDHNSIRQVWANVRLMSDPTGKHEPFGEYFLGRNWELWSGSEFTVFNSVIRLCKVEQLAYFHFSPCRLSLVELLAAVPGFTLFRFLPCRLSLVEQLAAVLGFNSFCQPCKPPSFFNVARERQTAVMATCWRSQAGTCLQVWWLFLFMVVGEVQLCI